MSIKIDWRKMVTDGHAGNGFMDGHFNGRKVLDIGRYNEAGRANHYLAIVHFADDGTPDCENRVGHVEMYFLLHDGSDEFAACTTSPVRRGFKTAHAALSAAKAWARETVEKVLPPKCDKHNRTMPEFSRRTRRGDSFEHYHACPDCNLENGELYDDDDGTEVTKRDAYRWDINCGYEPVGHIMKLKGKFQLRLTGTHIGEFVSFKVAQQYAVQWLNN